MRATLSINVVRSLRASEVIAAILGGMFVGQFSCGGYSWQTPLVRSIVGSVALLALAAWFFTGARDFSTTLARGGIFF